MYKWENVNKSIPPSNGTICIVRDEDNRLFLSRFYITHDINDSKVAGIHSEWIDFNHNIKLFRITHFHLLPPIPRSYKINRKYSLKGEWLLENYYSPMLGSYGYVVSCYDSLFHIAKSEIRNGIQIWIDTNENEILGVQYFLILDSIK